MVFPCPTRILNVRNHTLAISTGITIQIAFTYIGINRPVSKYSAIACHFTALSLGRTEYFLSAAWAMKIRETEWKFLLYQPSHMEMDKETLLLTV